jgi:1-pyrroline-5-carboxylate dehydrogenase
VEARVAAVFSNYYVMKLLRRPACPPGVINFVPGRGGEVGDPVMASEDLAGVHFTGSTAVFQGMWKTDRRQHRKYGCYPRIVGETGGKDFVFAHPSADVDALVTALVRGAFEYQGQKCSAASRAYIPQSLWERGQEEAAGAGRDHQDGRRPTDFRNFMGAVIDKPALRHDQGLHRPRQEGQGSGQDPRRRRCDDSKGYFIEPTVIECHDPNYETMVEEIFGPVLTSTSTRRSRPSKTLKICDTTSAYALTGAIFAQDRGRDRGDADALLRTRRQLLHQRQADRRGGRPAALRRLAGLGHQRQGRQLPEPDALGVARAR